MKGEQGHGRRRWMSPRVDTLKSGGWRSKAPLEARRAERGDKGFTLIELIIVVSVMPIIVGAISAGLIAVISLQNTVSSRLADTSDAQVVSSTFIKDVQSATFITTSATSSPQCGSTGTQLLGLQWGNTPQDIASGSPANPSTLVSYNLVPSTGASATTYSLVRELCTLGNYTTPADSTTVSYDVASTQPPPCYSSAACDPTDLVHNPQIGWTSPGALVPQSNQLLMPVVKFVIAEVKSNFTFTLVANSLSWTPAAAQSGTVGPAFSPLTLLSQAAGPTLTMSAGSILTITGTGTFGTTAAFSSTNDGAGVVPVDSDLTASTVFTEDPNLLTLSGVGLGVLTPEYYASSISDPLKTLFNSTTAPSASAPWPLTPTSCSVTGPLTYNCPSGLYAADPAFPSGSTVCFCAGFGNYEFAKTFVIPYNSTLTFDQGNYVFDGSPAITPGSALGNQTLTWQAPAPPASPSTSSGPNHTWTPAATSSSGLAVTFSIDGASSSGACSIVGGVVTFLKNGTCLVDANQAGNASFNPADQIQKVIPIPSSAKTTQTITFTSTKPSPAIFNATYKPVATAPGGTVTFTVVASPSTTCSIAGSAPNQVVTFGTTAGTCLINANQGGTSTYLQAPEAQQAVVVIAGNGTTSITGNNVLFYIPSGSVDFGNTSSVVLTPLLDGLSIWDATSNPATSVNINNVANNRNSYGGIYIPGGNVNASSSSLSGSMSVMFIVAKTLNMGGQTTLNVTGP